MSKLQYSKKSIFLSLGPSSLAILIGFYALFFLPNESQAQQVTQEVERYQTHTLPSEENAFSELLIASELSDYTGVKFDKSSKLWFKQAFNLGGNEFITFFYITKKMGSSEGAYVNRYLSTVTYKKTTSGWGTLSKQPLISTIGHSEAFKKPFDEAEILQLSPNSIAIVDTSETDADGYEIEGKNIFVFSQNTWREAGFIQTRGGDFNGCEPHEHEDEYRYCLSYTGLISVIYDVSTDFPDLMLTTMTSTEKIGGLKLSKEIIKFKDGRWSNHDF